MARLLHRSWHAFPVVESQREPGPTTAGATRQMDWPWADMFATFAAARLQIESEADQL